ncbi:major facilitator superfamily domain-containing protein [Lasiosphaeria miniovina]|uniref:Major facilitator superfamily domain-containing protein n=1 Tax=Lasiosphaeria miniovina TaxID=1954250 RepID=A0AA39ZYY4_9PEZI|nr:major facilitator superfamily domain-containing protein [Lasiosphaeria miniovina]KAK0706241.1 major facilitator superfamily domain-containing protein [Lasiosphaeria miniovina]
MTGPKTPSRLGDVEARLESDSSRQTASLPPADADAADAAVVSERKAGHEHDAYPTGLALMAILGAVAVSFFLVFLDMAVMSTVAPAVTTGFDALTDVGWYASAYQLASAACTPMTGKIYSYFHIRWSFLVFFLIFEVGSALSGAAASSNMFIVGRAVAGIGAAGLFTGMMTIVANVLPMHKRPAILGAIMGLGQLGIAGGPLIGGAFTSNVHATWRWCFYLNLCLFPLVTVAFLLNTIPEAEEKPPWRSVLSTAVKSLDLVGFVLISGGVLMFLLGLQYGGNQFAWDSSVVIGLIYRQGDSAMVPWAMLRSGIIRAASMTNFFNYGVMLVADFYLAIYFQSVLNDTPLESGVHMLPTTLGMLVSMVVAGGLTQSTGYYLPMAIVGPCISAVGYGLLSTLSPTTPTARWIGYQILYGVGSVFGNSSPYMAVQNLVPLHQVPQAMAIVLTVQTLGSSVWLIIANVIFNNSLRSLLQEKASAIGLAPDFVIFSAGARGVHSLGLSGAALQALLESYATSVDRVMYLGVGLAAGALLCCWGLGWHNILEIKEKEALRDKREAGAVGEGQGEDEGAGEKVTV